MTGLLALAIIPGIVVMVYIYKRDKIEKEPGKLLFKLFLFGVLSAIPAVVLECVGEGFFLSAYEDEQRLPLKALLIDNFIVVGLAEEYCKYWFLKKGSWKNPAFDFRFDAIVYAVVTSMGFAVFENIFYVLENGFVNGIVRALISIPGHASFAVCMGVFYGHAKFCEARNDKRGMKSNLRKAVILPMLMHGFFDFCLSTEYDVMIIVFIAYIIIMDIICIKKIKKHSEEDVRLSYVVETGDN